MWRKHILVVDDDPDIRCILQDRLAHRGYLVETAGDGHEALTKLDHAVFDGVLLDVMMPGITGLAVLQEIRKHDPSLPVVMMTGQTSSQVATQALAAGARACLLKPFHLGKFEQVAQCWFGTAVQERSYPATRN